MPRRSKVDGLPEALRTELDRVLSGKKHGGYHALASWLRERGYDISHAAVHRHDAKLQRTIAAVRASTEAARQLSASFPDQSDDLSQSVLRMVQSQMFEIMVSLQDATVEGDLAERLKLLSRALQAASQGARGSIAHRKWQDEARDRARAAADEIAESAKAAGLTDATIKTFRDRVMGIV